MIMLADSECPDRIARMRRPKETFSRGPYNNLFW